MKIEALTTFLHGADRYEPGDVRTVDDELGAYFCRAGWCKDQSGAVETGEQRQGDVILAPDGLHVGHAADNVG